MQTGFLLINKPVDWTSHDVIGYLRKVTGIKKIGHAGTLDPFATGLLIVGIGRQATKRLDEFKALPKTYITAMKLNAVSDTYDRTGNIKEQIIRNKQITKKQIKDVLKSFKDKQTQLPPMYSAKKVKGKKLYELARKGIEIERKPHKIEIYKIKLQKFKIGNLPVGKASLKLKIFCSPGTYIRTLVHDIGQKLETGAYCEELERTRIGKYKVKKAIEPTLVTKNNLKKFIFQLN
ncbi:MAG: tRNA pseudouridine(55) synthase TruB [Candidatus Magasanikbacteria bacterium]